jgi:hypothetical protein
MTGMKLTMFEGEEGNMYHEQGGKFLLSTSFWLKGFQVKTC